MGLYNNFSKAIHRFLAEAPKKDETKGKAQEEKLITPGAFKKEVTSCLFCHAATKTIIPPRIISSSSFMFGEKSAMTRKILALMSKLQNTRGPEFREGVDEYEAFVDQFYAENEHYTWLRNNTERHRWMWSILCDGSYWRRGFAEGIRREEME